jgi:hypothetical protein
MAIGDRDSLAAQNDPHLRAPLTCRQTAAGEQIGGTARERIRAPATLCDERRDDDPRIDASTVRVGVRPLETRARHLGSWRL